MTLSGKSYCLRHGSQRHLRFCKQVLRLPNTARKDIAMQRSTGALFELFSEVEFARPRHCSYVGAGQPGVQRSINVSQHTSQLPTGETSSVLADSWRIHRATLSQSWVSQVGTGLQGYLTLAINYDFLIIQHLTSPRLKASVTLTSNMLL
jgi:hypothetical protein